MSATTASGAGTETTPRARAVNDLRVFLLGGLTSYRALFTWLSPWIMVPTFVIGPLVQILLFAYVGRAAGFQDDRFFLLGNALHYVSIPCVFAMANTIGGERYSQTLPLLLVTPARRVPLFLGRSLPAILNGFAVAVVGLVLGALVLRVQLPAGSLLPLALVVTVATFSCTGIGLLTAAIALRVRETATLANIVFGVLLVFCGVNVPVAALPGWMAAVSPWLPLTHGIIAARDVASGAAVSAVGGLLAREALLGVGYVVLGLALLAWFERESRRLATLETA
ncbi:MAG TPA: ABC transporter permease [Motilibacteraceae bacterium]|nr:ABC transporter permease [Motilibacteraceae bacterium]